jgi:uncharacterized protein YecT (DUF1311 family)
MKHVKASARQMRSETLISHNLQTLMVIVSMCLGTVAVGDDSGCDGSAASIVECLDQKHAELDSQLNAAYKEVIRRFPFADLSAADKAKSKADFISSQREWIRFRDMDCATTATINGGGDASKYEWFDCLIRHTQQRIVDLKRYSDYLPEQPLK